MSRVAARSGMSPRYQNRNDTVKYVATAATSQGNALRKFGHTFMVLGYGASQYANHGRPRCMSGKIAACITAKSVMPSAMRLMLVRHLEPKRSKIALMKVPAWPMPIHHTKLMMPNAQATGMLFPQTP